MGKLNNQFPTSMTFKDKTSLNPELAESFNNYSCSIANNLAPNVEHTPFSYESYLPDPTFFSFYIQPIDTQEIEPLLKT